MAEGKDYLISAAIDFGTTFSGYAFSFLHDYQRDPLKVSANSWVAGNLMSQKTSTCVLFDKKGNFSKFGFEAEDTYSELAFEQEHEQWYYFRRFKMELYGEKGMNRNTRIKDESGKTMTAMKVFSAGIKYLKDHMLDACKNQLSDVSASDIRWVLTVPAIWSDSAKQFMRESAEQAGISADQLMIALEPEAASLFCRHIPISRSGDGGFSAFKSGSKYLVLDAGGGTIDITVHEVQSDGSLREIHKANGGDWGGTKVDDAFRIFLSRIVGNSAYDTFCYEGKYDMLELYRDFEVKKRTIKPDGNDSVNVKIPMKLNECCKSDTGKDISEQVKESGSLRGNVTVMGDKLRVKPNIARDLFKEAANNIVDHLKKLLRHPDARNVTSILMVGGFSESKILQDIIKQKFQQLKVIIPQDAGLAVLKGAVIYGHEPRTIKSRICKVTYGVKTTRLFNPDIHPLSKQFTTSNGEERCNDIFGIHVKEGETVNVGEPQVSREYFVTEPDQTCLYFEIWISHQRDPKYTTDVRCQMLGSLRIATPDTSRGLDRSANVQMTFGGTELKVEATDNFTGESVSASFDFLKI